jgi:hypothetical protein
MTGAQMREVRLRPALMWSLSTGIHKITVMTAMAISDKTM